MSADGGVMGPLRLVAVVAMAENRVIGRGGQLPWHLPGDLKFFKKLTTGHAVIMGRKTYASIGRPLPDRRNIVISRSLGDAPEGCELIRDPAELTSDAIGLRGLAFVIGGAEIYAAVLPMLDEIIVSHVRGEYPGDTFFPPVEDGFTRAETLLATPEFEAVRYRAKAD